MRHKKAKKIKSINFALWLNFIAFATGIILVISTSCFFVVGSSFVSQARNKIIEISSELSAQIESVNSDESLALGKISESEVEHGINAFILNGDGQLVIVDDDYSKITHADKIFASLKKELDKNDGAFALTRPNNETIYYACPVAFSGDNLLVVCYHLGVLNQTVSVMQANILWLSAIIIIIASLVSLAFAQRIARPIKSISETSMQLAKGNYSIDFAQAEFEELAHLSNTLNYVKDEIKKTETFRRELLANVSHDLKTPLTMIKAYASMIKEISGDNPEKREKHLQVIIEESDRLTGLVNDVLSVSKAYSELDDLNKKVFNVTEFLYGILGKFSYLQETQGYKFMVDVDPNLYTLADAEKIGQVFYNLISNAVNYTGEDKTVFISLKNSPEENRLKFYIKDTGKGIKDDEIENIWDRYYRSKDNHDRPVKGTGLGLNIVKYILQRHSFDFGVKSKVGEGSVFWVDFPAVAPLQENN